MLNIMLIGNLRLCSEPQNPAQLEIQSAHRAKSRIILANIETHADTNAPEWS
jgi:hypothetical protein